MRKRRQPEVRQTKRDTRFAYYPKNPPRGRIFGGAGSRRFKRGCRGFSEAAFRDRLGEQISIRKYLESAIDFSAITTTDEEVAALYDSAVAGGADAPPLYEVRGRLEAALVQDKQNSLIAAHIQELLAESEVHILLYG